MPWRKYRVVSEDASEVFFVREDIVLHREVDTRTVHQIDDGQMVLKGDLLCPQVLSGHGKPSAGFDRGIVGHDNALSFDPADHYHHTCSRTASVFAVHAFCGKGSDLK